MQLFLKILSGMANSVDPNQTAPSGAVYSGSVLFAYICICHFVRHFAVSKFYDIHCMLWVLISEVSLAYNLRMKLCQVLVNCLSRPPQTKAVNCMPTYLRMKLSQMLVCTHLTETDSCLPTYLRMKLWHGLVYLQLFSYISWNEILTVTCLHTSDRNGPLLAYISQNGTVTTACLEHLWQKLSTACLHIS